MECLRHDPRDPRRRLCFGEGLPGVDRFGQSIWFEFAVIVNETALGSIPNDQPGNDIATVTPAAPRIAMSSSEVSVAISLILISAKTVCLLPCQWSAGTIIRQTLVLTNSQQTSHIALSTASRIQRCRCMTECSEFTPQAGSTTKGPGT